METVYQITSFINFLPIAKTNHYRMPFAIRDLYSVIPGNHFPVSSIVIYKQGQRIFSYAGVIDFFSYTANMLVHADMEQTLSP